MHHQHNLRKIPTQEIKKSSGRLKEIFVQAIPREMPDPHSTARETSICHKLLFQSREGKCREIHTAKGVMDKGESSGQNHTIHTQQAVQKPCTTTTPRKNHDVIKTRFSKIIHKLHRLGIDA